MKMETLFLLVRDQPRYTSPTYSTKHYLSFATRLLIKSRFLPTKSVHAAQIYTESTTSKED